MTLPMSCQMAYQASHEPSVPPRASGEWLDKPSDSSNSPKTYHATGEWGKRGMTLQELTRAFDAFNEDEERVAIGFAGSEDCNRKLAEPLSDVKTIFLDLDGLKPLSGRSSFSPPSSVLFSPRLIPSHIPQNNPDIDTREYSELGYLMRTDVTSGSNEAPAIELGGGMCEDTIKPYQKRRRSLLISPLGTPCPSTLDFENEIPARPPSRLGFIDDGDIGQHSLEDGGDML